MPTIDLRGRALDARSLRQALPRAEYDVEAALDAVRPICEDVQHRGAEALRELSERFDGVRPAQLRVPAEVLAAALDGLDPDIRAALEESARRARLVHEDQRRTDSTTQVVPGGTVTERWVPVDRVGLYVPGGVAVLASSVIMNVVPAQAARVPSLAVASPPQRDNQGIFAGYPHPTVLAACALLGVDEVYAVGGAQAIAMFAYGASETGADGTPGAGEVVCEPVNLVTGPGNIYVVAAKRLLKGLIGIDSEAGPTEIAILADDSADPGHLAADLISQSEHDVLAASVLVTDSEPLADAVQQALETRVAATKHHERIRTSLTARQSGIVLVDDVDAGLDRRQRLRRRAPRDPDARRGRGRGAGDATAAPSSSGRSPRSASATTAPAPTTCCPPAAAPCHSSGLSVQSFLRGIHVVAYDEAALRDVARHVVTLAEAEDLPAHGEAVTARFGGDAS